MLRIPIPEDDFCWVCRILSRQCHQRCPFRLPPDDPSLIGSDGRPRSKYDLVAQVVSFSYGQEMLRNFGHCTLADISFFDAPPPPPPPPPSRPPRPPVPPSQSSPSKRKRNKKEDAGQSDLGIRPAKSALVLDSVTGAAVAQGVQDSQMTHAAGVGSTNPGSSSANEAVNQNASMTNDDTDPEMGDLGWAFYRNMMGGHDNFDLDVPGSLGSTEADHMTADDTNLGHQILPDIPSFSTRPPPPQPSRPPRPLVPLSQSSPSKRKRNKKEDAGQSDLGIRPAKSALVLDSVTGAAVAQGVQDLQMTHAAGVGSTNPGSSSANEDDYQYARMTNDDTDPQMGDLGWAFYRNMMGGHDNFDLDVLGSSSFKEADHRDVKMTEGDTDPLMEDGWAFFRNMMGEHNNFDIDVPGSSVSKEADHLDVKMTDGDTDLGMEDTDLALFRDIMEGHNNFDDVPDFDEAAQDGANVDDQAGNNENAGGGAPAE